MCEILYCKDRNYRIFNSSTGSYLVNNNIVLVKKTANETSISPAWISSPKHIKSVSEFLGLKPNELKELINFDKNYNTHLMFFDDIDK